MRPSETLRYLTLIYIVDGTPEARSLDYINAKDHILCKYREKSRHYKIHALIVEKAIRPLSAGEFSGEDFKRVVLNLTTLQGPV